MRTREKIIAVDFDGCLCENAWPEIGEAKQDVIDALLLRQKSGAKIILRCSEYSLLPMIHRNLKHFL